VRTLGEPLMNRLMSLAWEAEPIDCGLITIEAKDAFLGGKISLLRPRRDRAYFGKSKTKAKNSIDCLAILVEARSKSERIRKVVTKSIDGETIVVRRSLPPRNLCEGFQSLYSYFMRAFWLK